MAGPEGGEMGVDLGVAVVQRLDFRRENPPAILRAHSEQAPPDILAEPAGPQFECPVTGKLRVVAPDRLLHRAGYRREGVTAPGV